MGVFITVRAAPLRNIIDLVIIVVLTCNGRFHPEPVVPPAICTCALHMALDIQPHLIPRTTASSEPAFQRMAYGNLHHIRYCIFPLVITCIHRAVPLRVLHLVWRPVPLVIFRRLDQFCMDSVSRDVRAPGIWRRQVFPGYLEVPVRIPQRLCPQGERIGKFYPVQVPVAIIACGEPRRIRLLVLHHRNVAVEQVIIRGADIGLPASRTRPVIRIMLPCQITLRCVVDIELGISVLICQVRDHLARRVQPCFLQMRPHLAPYNRRALLTLAGLLPVLAGCCPRACHIRIVIAVCIICPPILYLDRKPVYVP